MKSPKRISPGKRFLNTGIQKKANALMFWQWGFSDVLANTNRGILAEFLVAWALGVHEKPRSAWSSWDVEFGNRKIEVKSTAYIQAWNNSKLSKPVFRIAPTSEWDVVKGYSLAKQLNSDIYVLCLFREKNFGLADPMDLSRWKFWVFSRLEIQQIFGPRKSIGVQWFEEEHGEKSVMFKDLKEKTVEIK